MMKLASVLLLSAAGANAQAKARPCTADADCTAGAEFCRPSTMDWDGPKACVAFSPAGTGCGGMMPPNYQTRCAPGLECVNTAGPMIADAGGTCGAPCANNGQRDAYGNCIDAGCTTWFDGCNTCTGGAGRQSCTEMFCGRPTGQAECRDAPDGARGRPGAAGAADAEEINCCGGGSACGFQHCAALGAGQEGCVRPWAMPNGMSFDTDCDAAAPAAPATDDMGAPEGCTTWFDGWCAAQTRTRLHSAPVAPRPLVPTPLTPLRVCFVSATATLASVTARPAPSAAR
jgi:hypothetical protein